MMNRLQYLLGLVGQECNEIGKEASKAAFFGLEDHAPGTAVTNASRVHQELDDLAAIVEMLNREFNFGYVPNEALISDKIDKVNLWQKYARQKGNVE